MTYDEAVKMSAFGEVSFGGVQITIGFMMGAPGANMTLSVPNDLIKAEDDKPVMAHLITTALPCEVLEKLKQYDGWVPCK